MPIIGIVWFPSSVFRKGFVNMPQFNLAFGQLTVEAPVNLSDAALAGTIRIGAFSYCNYGCEIGDAEIGRYCSIGQRSLIAPGEHPKQFLSTHPFAYDPTGEGAGMSDSDDYARITCATDRGRGSKEPAGVVRIGHDVWIGARATILRGAVIGHGAVIGAGAVVTNDVDPYSIVGGVPARHIRWRFCHELRRRLLEIQWWNYDLSALGERRDYSDVRSIVDQIVMLKSAGTLKPFNPEISIQTV